MAPCTQDKDDGEENPFAGMEKDDDELEENETDYPEDIQVFPEEDHKTVIETLKFVCVKVQESTL